MTTKTGMTKSEYLTLILTLGALTALGPLAIDLYLPAIPSIAKSMGEPLSHIQYTLSAYTMGFALSQLVYGPLSDRIGRRKVLFPGLFFFSLTSLMAAYCTTAVELIVVRVLQSFAAAALLVTIPAMARDLLPRKEVAKALSSILMVMTVAPLVAPLLGGQILQHFGWEMIFVVLAGVAALTFVLALARIQETLPVADRLMIPPTQLALNYANIIRHRDAMSCILCHALFFGGLFAFISGSPFIYIELFGVPPHEYGLLFSVNVLTMTVTNILNIRLVEKFKLFSILRAGSVLSALAGIALLFNAYTGFGGLAGIMIPVAIFIACISFTGPNSNAIALSYFPKSAGSANALAGALRFSFAGIASALVGVFHDGTAVPMTAVMAGCGILSLASLALTKRAGAPEMEESVTIG